MANDYSNIPDFDSLPPVKDMPQGCSWGIFDKNGKKDHIGCLNLLTPNVVQAALKEAQDGMSFPHLLPDRPSNTTQVLPYRSTGASTPSKPPDSPAKA